MSKGKEPINPFYVFTAIAGVIFTITACGYGLLMLRSARPAVSQTPEQVHPLMRLLDQHGILILAVEVGFLAVASVAAIMLDHYRGRRMQARNNQASKGE